LTSLEYHFEHLQLVKCCLLENSKDETTQAIYKHHKERVQNISSRWKASVELAKIDPVVDHNIHFSGQSGREGLGFVKSHYIAKPSKRGNAVPKLLKLLPHVMKMILYAMPPASFSRECGRNGKMLSLLTFRGLI